MPTTNLLYYRTHPQMVGNEVIYYERIKAFMEIGTSTQLRQDCLVDCGAVLSLFPEKRWRQFQSEITWLHPPGQKQVARFDRVTGLCGARGLRRR